MVDYVMAIAEGSEALIVTEDDVSEIRLEVNKSDHASISNFG